MENRKRIARYAIIAGLVLLLAGMLFLFSPYLQVSEFQKSVEKDFEAVPLGSWLVNQFPWHFLFAVIVVIGLNKFGLTGDWIKSGAEWVVCRYFPVKPEFLKMPKPSENPLEFSARRARLVGQGEKLAVLGIFLEKKEKFLWWFLVGEGGSGKSRLALEWILGLEEIKDGLRRNERYHVGFLEGEIEKGWKPIRDTVIILDNAGEGAERKLEWVEGLGQNSEKWEYRVRMVFIERSVPKLMEDIEKQSRYSRYRYTDVPLTTTRLDEGQVSALSRDYAEHMKGRLGEEDIEKIEEISEGNPLIAQIAVGLLIETGKMDWQNRADLLEELAVRMMNKFEQQGYKRSCQKLLGMATLAREVTREQARDYIKREQMS